jgi:hypothetical protein
VNTARRRWDQLLDWWEFTASRFIERHRYAVAILAVLLSALAVIASTLAYAAAPTDEFVIINRALLNDAIEPIQRLEAENAALRAKCPTGTVAI